MCAGFASRFYNPGKQSGHDLRAVEEPVLREARMREEVTATKPRGR